jgi:hypothetical protein
MALTAEQKRARNAGYQARWRARRDAAMKVRPEVIERELLQVAGRSCRLSDQERLALADKLADAAMDYLRRAQEFARMARRVRTGER